MNTFNEFELNKIRRLYAEELASRRLQRSRSSRLGGHLSPEADAADRCRSVGRSVERLVGGRPEVSPTCEPAGVDLRRYERALSHSRPPRRRGRAGSRYARALFDFAAKNERELSVQRGDLLEMIRLVDHNWAQVEDCQSGLQGLVPLAFIDYSVGCGVARRDVTAAQRVQRGPVGAADSCQGDLLPMSKGEPITLIRRLSDCWYEASNTRCSLGLVWSQDVDVIKQPVLVAPVAAQPPPATLSDESTDMARADDLYARHQNHLNAAEDEERVVVFESGERALIGRARAKSTSGLSQLHKNISLAPTAEQQDHARKQPACTCNQCSELQLREPRRSSSSPYISTVGSPPPPPQQVGVPHLCRARFAYKPRQRDELELVPGDILMVVHECDDGWLIGSSYSSKQMGTFPGNFVESI